MNERPTDPPASSATEPATQRPHDRASDARGYDERSHAASSHPAQSAGREPGANRAPSSGQSLATRAARFRNGAPFLVERATLYDPYPLDPLPLVEVKTLPRRRSRPLLPAALTLLGVVVVVGLGAGVLFVRNADMPRHGEGTGHASPAGERGTLRKDTGGGPQGGIAYDLTRRPQDAITGAWRLSSELEKETERAPAPPVRISEPSPAAAPQVPEAPRRLLPRHLAIPRMGPTQQQIAEPRTPERAPLDEPHVPKAVSEVLPKAVSEVLPKAVSEVPPKAVVVADPAASQATEPSQQKAVKQAENERPGPNVVARVRRESDEPDPAERRRRSGMPIRPNEEAKEARPARSSKSGGLSRRALLEQQRKMRKAAREAQDLDRFLLRNAGDIPKGFVFSGPQGQRP